MPQMQWLEAQKQGPHLHLHVWLDTDQKTPTGEPDPRYTRTYRFAAEPPPGWTNASLNGTAYTDWHAYCVAEAQLLAAADYAAMHPPVAILSVQGQVFTTA